MLAEQSPLPGVKDPYLGYRLTTLDGQYTTITDGIRKSYEPAVSGDRVSVWFFGASALFGDGQRGEHTIPSEFARLAEADGIPVEVRNYGRPGTSMWQELELFEQVVATGQKPDLVVFYDGFNDLAWQMNVRLSAEPDNIFETAGTDASTTGASASAAAGDAGTTVTPPSASADGGTSFSDVVHAYWDQSASHHVYDALHDLIVGSDQPSVQFAKGVDESAVGVAQTKEQITQAATNVVSIQARAANVATAIAGGVGAETAFFWQPSVFTKQLVPDEKAYLKLTGYQPDRWVPAVDQARAVLKGTPYVDLSTSLDGPTQPLLWDFVHTNEEGARALGAGDLREPARQAAAADRLRRGHAMKILGISVFYHDSAAALVVDGELVAAAQEERFTRKKHDAAFPEHAIAYRLQRGGVGRNGVDAVVYYDKPITTFVRLLKTYLRVGPKGIRSFSTAMPSWTRREVVDPVRDPARARAHRLPDAEGHVVHRAPREPRRQRVLPVTVRERRDPHLRRSG